MPDEITVKPVSETTPTEASANSANESPGVTLNRSHLIAGAAVGMLIAFFLPWVRIFFGSPVSGFDLQKLSNGYKLLWLIPIASVITIFATFTGRSPKIAAQVTGTLPFIALAYWLYHLGGDLLKVLSIGAWLSLICGLALFILPRGMK